MDNIKLRQLDITKYGCFDKATINFADTDSSVHKWTVLLGNNNTGKTSILKAIAELRPIQFKTPTIVKEGNIKFVPSIFYDKPFLEMLSDGTEVSAKLSTGGKWSFSKETVTVSSKSLDQTFLIFGYGVSRYPSSTSLSENKAKPCDTLFSADSRLVNLEEWLMQLDYAAKNDKSVADKRLYLIRELICGNLFPEIKDFSFESSEALHNYVLFQTEDGAFRYTQLGYGYQSMLSWVVDLCKRMFDAYPDSDNPLYEGAIVLIDEIDLHLHPKWQRDIISYLSKAFPNVQFIVTTHSPLVVQSIEDINLYVLHRDEEGKVCLEKSNKSNYSGWSVEEILRDTMGLNSDVHSDIYNQLLEKFNEGLEQSDKDKVQEAFNALEKILHPNNPIRRMLELQKNTME